MVCARYKVALGSIRQSSISIVKYI